jgi:hypothetical protein
MAVDILAGAIIPIQRMAGFETELLGDPNLAHNENFGKGMDFFSFKFVGIFYKKSRKMRLLILFL